MSQRLHVLLAHAGIASRRKSEALIAEGRVRVNGEVAVIGQQVEHSDHIEVDGKLITASHHEATYIILHKPVGVVSTTSDELGRRTVLDLLPPDLQEIRVYPVGRLDTDSEGLMLLTDDGELAYRLTHAKFVVPKTYWTQLDHQPTFAALEHLRRGVRLKDGWAKPNDLFQVPVSEAPSEGHWWGMTITEGRNHQVKRMWHRSGYEVLRLIRVALGTLRLSDLGERSVRVLSPAEVAKLRASVDLR